jgi:hypothetical protein
MLTAMTIALNHRINERTQRDYQRRREQRSLKQIPNNPENDHAKY